MTTAEKIRAARKKAGFTQKQLGDLCGIAEPTIRKYELGKLNPKRGTLEKIAKPLGVYYLDLYGDDESKDIAAYVKAGIKLGLSAQMAEQRLDFLEPFRERGYEFTESEHQIVSIFNRLNGVNQEKAITNIAKIYLNQCTIEDMKNHPNQPPLSAPQSTPPSSEGTDTTPPPDAPETPPEGK